MVVEGFGAVINICARAFSSAQFPQGPIPVTLGGRSKNVGLELVEQGGSAGLHPRMSTDKNEGLQLVEQGGSAGLHPRMSVGVAVGA